MEGLKKLLESGSGITNIVFVLVAAWMATRGMISGVDAWNGILVVTGINVGGRKLTDVAKGLDKKK